MKRIIVLIAICCQVLGVAAQTKAPKWMDKQRGAVITVTTYGKDNVKKTSGLGFFVTETGEAVSAYSLFENAEKASVTDVTGKEYPVSRILGADAMYDVIRFKVEIPSKTRFLSIAHEPIVQGSTVYLMPFSKVKIKQCQTGSVLEVSKLKEPYAYYKLAMPFEQKIANAPILTDKGEVFGLAQEDATGNQQFSYAVSAGYANSLKISSTDAFNSIYGKIGIKKAWPAEEAEAQVALYLMANTQDPDTYLATVNDFIDCFPQNSEGYVSRANHFALNRVHLATTKEAQVNFLKKALEDMDTAAKYSDKVGDNWFKRAKLIYNVAVSDTTIRDEQWTVSAAYSALRKAIEAEDQPIYHQLEGDIYFYQGLFEQAYSAYMMVNQSKAASSGSWFWAAKAKENIRGANIGEIINMLDSAIVKGENAPADEIGAYLLERADLRLKLLQYKEAITDYNRYFVVVRGNVSDHFFYLREQARFRANDLEGSLADIQTALRFNPGNPVFHAEEAAIFIRMKEYDKALSSLDRAIQLVPNFAPCYRLRGVCKIRQNKKAEAMEAFQKAKELGDPVVEKLIKEYSK